jgi:hypothetical protein
LADLKAGGDEMLNEDIAKLGNGKAAMLLASARDMHAGLENGDLAKALKGCYQITEFKDNKRLPRSHDGSWKQLFDSVQPLLPHLKDLVGEELMKQETIPTDKDWYAPEGTVARKRAESIVKEFQQAIKNWPESKIIRVGDRTLAESLVEVDGKWGPSTLNAVLAAENALHLKPTGWISNKLIEKLPIPEASDDGKNEGKPETKPSQGEPRQSGNKNGGKK